MIWKDEDVQQMLKLLGEGLSATVVGRRFGVTRNAIIGKLNRLKIKVGDLTGFNTRRITARAEARKNHRVRPRLALYDGWRPARKGNVVTFKPKPKPVINLDHKCTIIGLNSKTCRWPLWADADNDRFYCGAPIEGLTYCPAHSSAAGRKYDPSRPLVTNSVPAKSPKSMAT
jgi:GcrA cell cycle regulator